MFFSVFSVPSRVGAVRLVILSSSEAHAPTLKKNQKLKGIFFDFFAKMSHFYYKNALMLIKVMISEQSALKSLTSGSPSCPILYFSQKFPFSNMKKRQPTWLLEVRRIPIKWWGPWKCNQNFSSLTLLWRKLFYFVERFRRTLEVLKCSWILV